MDKIVNLNLLGTTYDLVDDEAVRIADVKDNLTTTTTNVPLSANQGKVLKGLIDTETTNRTSADTNLQNQIDAIVASSDVKDIVGTKAELNNYDTSTLGNKDIIKVLQDESQNNATTYYRWSTSTSTFTLIGQEGPYYTKSTTDTLLNGKQNKLTAGTNIQINNNTISATDTKYTAGSGLNLSGTEFSVDSTVALKTDLPTVNNATLTIQKNGTTVKTFTANASSNVTANITVPTKTSDLTNDGADNTSTYVEADELATVATSGSYNDLSNKPTILNPTDYYWANVKVSNQSANNTEPQFNNIKLNRKNTYPHIGGDGEYLALSADGQWGQGHGSIALKSDSLYPNTNENGRISLGESGRNWKNLHLSGNLFHGTYQLTLPSKAGTVALTSDLPTVNNATLTIQHNGTSRGTFTANASSNVTANINATKHFQISDTQTDFARWVVALCRVSTTNNTSLNSYSIGKITMHRDNGLEPSRELNIGIDNQYALAYYTNVYYYANLPKLSPTVNINDATKTGWRPCTFKYNNQWYGGVEIYTGNAAKGFISFEGETNENVFGVVYYTLQKNASTPAVINNQEIYDSLNYTQCTISDAEKFFYNKIDLAGGELIKNSTYTATLPNKTGTLAMTSDITTAVEGTAFTDNEWNTLWA